MTVGPLVHAIRYLIRGISVEMKEKQRLVIGAELIIPGSECRRQEVKTSGCVAPSVPRWSKAAVTVCSSPGLQFGRLWRSFCNRHECCPQMSCRGDCSEVCIESSCSMGWENDTFSSR